MKLLKVSLLLFGVSRCRAASRVDQIQGRIGLRALVLSTEKPDSILTSLASYGIAYDNLIYNCDNILEGDLYLFDENTGYPKYNMIVIANGRMKCNCNGIIKSVFNKEHWNTLNDYEVKYNIRSVVINEDNDIEEIGIKPFEFNDREKNTITLKSANNSFTHSLFDTAGIYDDAPLDSFGIEYNLAKIVDEKISTPILYYDIKNEISYEKPVAAVYSKLKDGNERLTFFVSSNKRTITSIIINHLWIPWVSKNLYIGFRRVYLTQHIDDVFSSEDLILTSEKTIKETYRNTIEDFNNIIEFQNNISYKMPVGSSYRLELAFNGFGLIENTMYKFELIEDPEVSNTYIKPKGSGVFRWPHFPYDTDWSESEISKNKLYEFIKNKEINKNFYWCSHGFTHQSLNLATSEDVINQINTNIKMAVRLSIYDNNFSKRTIITPGSSGLHNVDAIEAFFNRSIISASGNINRPDITKDEFYEKNAYLPWRTTEESSNIANFSVIPRIPTMIFSECSTPLENTVKYNRIFEGTGIGTSFDEILNRDSQMALLYLLQLRHNPFQFHQSNLRSADLPSKKSLIELWTEKLIDTYNKYVKWPIISLKVDDIHNTFLEREKYEKCNLEQKLIHNNTHIIAITLKAYKSCKVPISLPYGISINEDDLYTYKNILSIEQVSEIDPITIWVDMKNNSVELNFSPAIYWGQFKVNSVINILDPNGYYFKKNTSTKRSQTKSSNNLEIKTTPSILVLKSKNESNMNKFVNSSHNIITNIITNVLKFNSISNKMISKYYYTTEQLTNPKAFKELDKSRLYVERIKDLYETQKKEKYITNNLKHQKIKYLKSSK